jgi:hypothetical protein
VLVDSQVKRVLKLVILMELIPTCSYLHLEEGREEERKMTHRLSGREIHRKMEKRQKSRCR